MELPIIEKKNVPCFSIESGKHDVEVWENEKFCGNMNHRQVSIPQLFRILPNFHECF